MPEYFQDAIHGLIRLCPLANHIINTKEFNRLRYIKQLSSTHYIYAGAKHARFEHSVGTYAVTRKYVKHLQDRCPEVKIRDRDITLIAIAGLLHDIGHCTLGHSFDHHIIPYLYEQASERDKVKVKQLQHHEARSVQMVRHMYKKYDWENKWMKKDEMAFICNLIRDINRSKDPNKSWMWDIVSNSTSFLDTDKLDYLLRDHAAVGFGVPFQLDQILTFSSIKDGHIVYETKLRPILWNIFRSRFDMHQTVYQHPSAVIVDHLFCKILTHHAKELKITEALISEDCAWDRLIDPIFATIKLDAYSQPLYDCIIGHQYPPYDVLHDGKCVKSKSEGGSKVLEVIDFFIGFFPKRKNYFPQIPFLKQGEVVYNQIPDPPKSIRGRIRIYQVS